MFVDGATALGNSYDYQASGQPSAGENAGDASAGRSRVRARVPHTDGTSGAGAGFGRAADSVSAHLRASAGPRSQGRPVPPNVPRRCVC